jgi:hypothetical protein
VSLQLSSYRGEYEVCSLPSVLLEEEGGERREDEGADSGAANLRQVKEADECMRKEQDGEVDSR